MRIAVPAHLDSSALADRDPRATVGRLAGETMGTTWSVQFATRPHLEPASIRRLIEARLADIVAQMSHWEPDSLISRFNTASGGEWTALPTDFATVIAQGLTIAEASRGAFDPTIGRLVDLWGFGPKGACSPPEPEHLQCALAQSGWQRIAYDTAAHRIRQPGGLSLDLSGIAKGYAVDALADMLVSQGLRHVLVEIGGELVGRGMRPDSDPWWVDLENPPDANCPPLRIALHGLAVATSGSYRRGHHSIDPRTGVPVRNGIVSLSVIDRSALAADAWATALTVLGVDAGLTLATEHKIAARFIVQSQGTSTEHLTPALVAMLDG